MKLDRPKWKNIYSKKKDREDRPISVGENGLPQPLEAKCFECRRKFFINYVVFRKQYSRKNNWEYWVNSESKNPDFWEDKEARKKDKKICSSCLLKLFYDKERFWKTIKDPKRKQQLKVYVYTGVIE